MTSHPTTTPSPRPRRALGILTLILLAAGASACSSTGRQATGSPLHPDLITLEEIQRSSATNAYDLVHQVRPNWLRGRGMPSFRDRSIQLPVVYLGDRPQGSIEVLRSFATGAIAELRYINATSATTRYGDGHAGGIIELVMLRH